MSTTSSLTSSTAVASASVAVAVAVDQPSSSSSSSSATVADNNDVGIEMTDTTKVKSTAVDVDATTTTIIDSTCADLLPTLASSSSSFVESTPVNSPTAKSARTPSLIVHHNDDDDVVVGTAIIIDRVVPVTPSISIPSSPHPSPAPSRMSSLFVLPPSPQSRVVGAGSAPSTPRRIPSPFLSSPIALSNVGSALSSSSSSSLSSSMPALQRKVNARMSATPHAGMRYESSKHGPSSSSTMSSAESREMIASMNALTWPPPRGIDMSLLSMGASPMHASSQSRLSRSPHQGEVALSNIAFPLPIGHLNQSTVHLNWRIASQRISLRLQDQERTRRALQNRIENMTRTGGGGIRRTAGATPNIDRRIESTFDNDRSPQRKLTFEEEEANVSIRSSTTMLTAIGDVDITIERTATPEVKPNVASSAVPDVASSSPAAPSRHTPVPASSVTPSAASPSSAHAGRELLDADWHRVTLDDLASTFECDLDSGLLDTDIVARRLRDGANLLSPPTNARWKLVLMFLKQLVQGFGLILWIAALLAFLAWKPFGSPADPTNLGLGVVLIVVVVGQASFNFYQEYQSNAIMDSFRGMIPTFATVIRRAPSVDAAGETTLLATERDVLSGDLIIGDLVKLQMGQKIPADIRLLEVQELKVNNSALTGEMEPIASTVQMTSTNYLESSNMAWFGSMAVEGSGMGIVVAVGDATVLGKISKLSTSEAAEPLTLHVEITRFVWLICSMAVITAIISWIGYFAWLQYSYPNFLNISSMMVNIVGLVVAYLPTGLPISVTLTLTIIAKRMYRQQVLVKNLATVETFNSVTVIATDKTGTLTMNIMSVAQMVWGATSHLTSGIACRGVGIHADDTRNAIAYNGYRYLIQGAQLCNNAVLRSTVIGEDSVDNAISSEQATLSASIDAHVHDMRGMKLRGINVGDSASPTGAAPLTSSESLLLASLSSSSTMLSTFGSDLNVSHSSPRDSPSRHSYSVLGDAADTAFYNFCATQIGLNVELTRVMYERVRVLPFNSKNKFMITIHENWRHKAEMMEVAVKQTMIGGQNGSSIATVHEEVDGDCDDAPISSSPSLFPSSTSASSLYPPLSLTSLPHIVWMKGASEIVLSRCTTYLDDSGAEHPLSVDVRNRFNERIEDLCRCGERVLGFARLELDYHEWSNQEKINFDNDIDAECAIIDDSVPIASSSSPAPSSSHRNDTPSFPSSSLCFVGMMSLIDPPRPNVASAVLKCRGAGIQVAMVTGDHAITAAAIARKVNILSRLSSYEIGHMSHNAPMPSPSSGSSSIDHNGNDDQYAADPSLPAFTHICQDSLSVTTDSSNVVSVVMLRDGIEIGRHVPEPTLEEQARVIAQVMNDEEEDNREIDADGGAKANVGSTHDERINTRRSRTAQRDDIIRRIAVRSKLKDVLLHPIPIPQQHTTVKSTLSSPSNANGATHLIKSVNGSMMADEVLAVPIVRNAIASSNFTVNIIDADPSHSASPSGSTPADNLTSILPLPYSLVLTGSHLRLLDDALWDWVMRHTEGVVFARTSPEQKLRIVIEYQRRGHIVAVTGDGVNDSPALKKANLGVAMQSGAEVAREAGDMILLDNNFGSVVTAIEMGRTVFDNLKKVTLYLLPAGSWSEMLPVLANVFLGMPLPLSPFLMIVICVLTDMFPSLALVQEQPENNIMSRLPRDIHRDHLVDSKLIFFAYLNIGLIESVAGFVCFLRYFSMQGLPPRAVVLAFDAYTDGYRGYTQAQLNEFTYTGQSVFFVTLVIVQFGNLLATRTRKMSITQQNPFWGAQSNPSLIFAMIASLLCTVMITEIPWINATFNTRHVPITYVAPAIGFAFLTLAYDEARKWYIRREPNSWMAKIAW